MIRTLSIALASMMLLICATAEALPLLDSPVSLPADVDALITIYPDSDNTREIRRYWIAPSLARIARRPDGKLAFGLSHSGISGYDPDGINALLDVAFQPYIDAENLDKAKAAIEKQAKTEGATTVTFSYVVPTETTCNLLVGGQQIDWTGTRAAVINGGAIENGIPFQYKLDKSFDVRCLTQAGGNDGSRFGVLFTMKFQGVGNRVNFIVRAKKRTVYEHFKAKVSASGWFGLAKASASTEWEDLKKTGGVKLEIKAGTPEQVEKYHAQTILQNLIDQVSKESGMFARELKPRELPNFPGGGGFLGWSVRAGVARTTFDEQAEFVVEVDARETREHEIAFGMNFPSSSEDLKSYVLNLTDSNKPFPTSDDFKKAQAHHEKCADDRIERANRLFNDRKISESMRDRLVIEAETQGCYRTFETRAIETKNP